MRLPHWCTSGLVVVDVGPTPRRVFLRPTRLGTQPVSRRVPGSYPKYPHSRWTPPHVSRGLFSKSFAPPVGFPPYSGFKSRKCHPWLVDNEGEIRQARQQWSNGEDKEQCRRPRRPVPTSPASCMQASPASCAQTSPASYACRRPLLPVRTDAPRFLCVQTSPASCVCADAPASCACADVPACFRCVLLLI